MKKQIIYPKFTARVLSGMIDMILVIFICTPILGFVSKMLLKIALSDYTDITMDNIQMMLTQERIEGDDHLKNSLMMYVVELLVAQIILLGAYYVVFWHYFGYTPGKYFFRMRIVDFNTMEHPTLWRFIKRFLGYLLAPLNLVVMLFDKQNRGLHDKIANTIVITA